MAESKSTETRLLAGPCGSTFSKSFFSFPPCPPFLDDLQRAESARPIGAIAGVTQTGQNEGLFIQAFIYAGGP